jgi:hypothetical protein
VAVNTWAELADLRKRGARPALPVYVTDKPILARNMRDIGCVAILHRKGQPMPVELLAGLDVRMDFGRCELVGRVKRLMDAKDVEPASMRAWCQCGQDFVAVCGPCDDGSEPWSS